MVYPLRIVEIPYIYSSNLDPQNTIKLNVYLLRNWSFFELQTLIKYKAERVGIQVLFVDAYFTSLQCAKCGSLEKGQRINQTTFVCKNLTCEGYKINISADYNAAVNIARSKKTVNKQADSAYANKII